MPARKLKYIDLFCGMGSFHYSFSRLGMKCVMACDIDDTIRNTYKKNYGIMPLGDIRKIGYKKKIAAHDILCAGFPCQPFSKLGKHRGFREKKGGRMFGEIIRILRTNKPRAFILENVPALVVHNNGRTFKTILTRLRRAGYIVTHKILKCSDYGIPQMRRRVFIVGIHKDLGLKLEKVQETMFNLKAYERKTSLTRFLRNGKYFVKPLAHTIRCGSRHSGANDGHNWASYYVNDSPLDTNFKIRSADINHRCKVYKLNMEDALRLQGFPRNFKLLGSDTKKWKVIGNTIPTIFTKLLGKQIKMLLNNK